MNNVKPERYFQDSLDAWMDKCAEQELRDEQIIEEAAELVREGNEYYPWTFEHYEEAMAEAPEASRRLVWMFITGALKPHNQDRTSHHVLNAIKSLVEEYWDDLAIQHANYRNDHRWD